MSPLELLEKNIQIGNIKQINASQVDIEGSLLLSAANTAQERDREEQFEARMYIRNSNHQYDYDYYYDLNIQALPSQKPEAAPEEGSSASIKRSMQFRAKFWSLIFMVLALPLINSAFYNAYALSKNIAQQLILSEQLSGLLEDKQDLQNKLKEYSSDSGIERAIKQEMNLVESNEIVIKIVQS